MPESWTAITTSERPVSLRHAISTLIPLTPKSSFALALIVGSGGRCWQKFVLAYFHFSPLQLVELPLISFASGMHPGGSEDESQRLGLAGYGKGASAAGAR